LRIIGGSWRGRSLTAPAGQSTRPTADRVRQALFDTLLHAAWGGRSILEDAHIIDVFSGTGALGLEALSRGAAHTTFIENHPAALKALRANISALQASSSCTVLAVDVGAIGRGAPAGLAFLDPPYGQGLVERALSVLRSAGRLGPGAVIVAETGRNEASPHPTPLHQRSHGAATISIWRETDA
jgi:16S rRNA (guanine966-N2)-methyltransferase